jgi:hypothetical protein
MIKIDFDNSGILSRIEQVQENIEILTHTLPEEFTAWQKEDMNRRRPWTGTRGAKNRALTIIWPGGWHKRKARERKRRRRKKGQPIVERRNPRPRTKPILRQVLFERLVERMGEWMKRTFEWR